MPKRASVQLLHGQMNLDIGILHKTAKNYSTHAKYGLIYLSLFGLFRFHHKKKLFFLHVDFFSYNIAMESPPKEPTDNQDAPFGIILSPLLELINKCSALPCSWQRMGWESFYIGYGLSYGLWYGLCYIEVWSNSQAINVVKMY